MPEKAFSVCIKDSVFIDFACGTGGFITSWLGQLSRQVTDTSAQKQLDDSIYGIEKKPFPYLLCVTNMLLHDIEVPNIYHMNSLKHNLLDYTDADKFDVILMNPPYGGHEDKSIQGFFPDDLASSETADLFMSVILYRLKKNGRAAVVVPDGFLFGLPDFLCEEMQEFFKMQYGLKKKDRIFTINKSYLHREMDRGAEAAGVKRIRIHDLRHSHISLLIDMGFSAVAIADRVGHESIEITYRYAHLFPSKQKEMASKLDDLNKGA